MLSFEGYKDRVTIVQVAEALGYELNKKAGKNPLEFQHPDLNTIVISNTKGRQRYFTRHESENKGSVIDFVKHRLSRFQTFYSKESEGVNKVLASFAGTPYKSPHDSWQTQRKQPFDLKGFKVSIPEMSDLLYLSNMRGLSESTLSVFLPYIRLVQPVYRKPGIINIGFPYHVPGEKGWVGFELVNYLFKGHALGSDKANALWLANLSQLGANVPNAFIAESAIDAMSFYQLYRHKFDLEKALFLSSGGYVTDGQVRNMLKICPHATIHTLFDNDLSGHLYDIRVACMKENKNLRVHKEAGQLHFELDNKSFVLPQHETSLTNFRKASGLRPNIRVHKAEGKDFNEMLLERERKDLRNSLSTGQGGMKM